MYYTTFDPTISHLESFQTIGYDPSTKTLQILFLTGEQVTCFSIDEAVVFSLITAYDKEGFIREIIETTVSTTA
jgi:hypothetical protein